MLLKRRSPFKTFKNNTDKSSHRSFDFAQG